MEEINNYLIQTNQSTINHSLRKRRIPFVAVADHAAQVLSYAQT